MTATRLRWALWGATLLTVIRAFRSPSTYALGSWLTTWHHGFVPRGLVGTVIRPLLAWKSAGEIAFLLQTLSAAVLLALVSVFVGAAVRTTRAAGPWDRAAVGGVALAVATSAWPVLAGSTDGFLDHLIELVTLGCVAAAGTRWQALIPLGCAAGALIHEEFVVYGLPVVVAAQALHVSGDPRPGRRLAEIGASLAVVVLVVGVTLTGPGDTDGLREEMRHTGVLSSVAIDNAVYHVETPLSRSWAQQSLWLSRVTRPDIDRVVLPPLILLGAVTAGWAWRAGLRWSLLLWPAVVGAPLALHLVAWDTPRFSIMMVFSAWATWCAVVDRWPRLEMPGPTARSVVAASAVVVGLNLVQPVPLLIGDVDGDGVLALRYHPSVDSFEGCTPVFPNAGFERASTAGWTVEGDPFVVQSAIGPHGARSKPGSIGLYWAESWARPEGDARTGRLTSPSFQVSANTLLFALGGGDDPLGLTVSLQVDGEVVRTATGSGSDTLEPRSWSVRALRGKAARIVIDDASRDRGGHLQVDGFCWYRP